MIFLLVGFYWSKQHIKKVMFLCATARPRFDHGRNAWFDGKLGIWPIVEYSRPAQRSYDVI